MTTTKLHEAGQEPQERQTAERTENKGYALPSFTTEDAAIPQGRDNGLSPFTDTVKVQVERFLTAQGGGEPQSAQVLGFSVTGEDAQKTLIGKVKRGLAKASPDHTVRTKDAVDGHAVKVTFWLTEKIVQKRTPRNAVTPLLTSTDTPAVPEETA